MDIIFHYPPELVSLLINVLPKLCKSKRDLLLFFQGAGVSRTILEPYERLLKTNKDSFNKYPVTREILTKLNEQGEKTLQIRRELLKRITEFDDFSVCWEKDQAVARGLVAQIRDLINVKDSFTRMRIEKDEEKRRRLAQQESVSIAAKQKRDRQQAVKDELYALFSEKDAHKRGKALEKTLNNLFSCFDILVREAFTIKGKCGEGVIEQIDGLIELEGHLYLVEVKWLNTTIGVSDIAPHLVRVFNRGGQARGLFVSYTDFTDPAIAQCRDALSRGAVVVLSTLQEFVSCLERESDLKQWLKSKVNSAIVDKQPFVIVNE
jgi:hypothetical protein